MEEKPQGVLSEHYPGEDTRAIRTDVELAGEVWKVEFNYLSLGQYATIAPGVTDTMERKIVVAEAMAPTLNGEKVNVRALDPLLGMELIKYLEMELSKAPGKNY